MKKVMIKRLISVCFAVILIFNICSCAQTVEDTPVEEPEIVETDYTETENEEESDSEDIETIAAAEEHDQDEEEIKSIADA